MSVKEFCLVPRSLAETSLPPKLQVKATSHQELKETPQNVSEASPKSEADTTLDENLKIILKPMEYHYAHLMLSFLRKHPLIRWDSSGNMLSPIRDVNIVDIIRYWLNRNNNFDSSKIPDLRMLVKLVNLPPSFVKNPKAKAQLFKGGVKKKNIRWDPY